MTQDNSPATKVKFLQFSEELIALAEQDQKEIRENFHAFSKLKSESIKRRNYSIVAENCHARALRMFKILEEIKEPTVENIGLEGSKAVSLLALHSYLDIMKKVLELYRTIYEKKPENIYYQAIPPLTDRIMILEHKKQLFGTQWSLDVNENPFLITVEDFTKMNQRRAVYGLDPVRRPVNMAIGAVKNPLGKGLAKVSDQKQLTEEEYERYSRHYLKSEL